MITFYMENCNTFSQFLYDKVLSLLQIHRLICPSCGKSGCLSIHGYYERSLRTQGGKIKLCILRLKCRCGRTHAVLPSSIVPYSQIALSDQVLIVESGNDAANIALLQLRIPDLSTALIRYIKLKFKRFFAQRLISYHLELHPVSHLPEACFRYFSCQFMQIRRTSNILFHEST